ncbi:prefoldin subunit [Thermococcus stetteri]|uniref:prefoldin subunit n=1 Tax=Thermococcus stetteri TaxID=49900 RepID=UPI001AE8D2BC|nr:prefoldin subunit [Thermococcus stetteri]MBP1910878.1 prefoldin beta subunit [Thermococcus stetteri]
MEAVKAYELQIELQQVRSLRQSLELKLKELEYAEGIITSLKSERKLYRALGDLLVEITKEEALEHIERSRLVYKREIERLKKREKEIMEELSKLKAPLS